MPFLRCSRHCKYLARLGAPGALDLGPAPRPDVNFPSAIYQLVELTKNSVSGNHSPHLYRCEDQPPQGRPWPPKC